VTGPARTGVAPPIRGTEEHRLERAILLELLAVPGRELEVGELSERVEHEPRAVSVAIAALVAAGVVERGSEGVRASACACYFDALWPIAV
jgi:predicted transcriptional regulator